MESLSPSESRLIAKDRLRWLSIGYFISGATGAVSVSILLIHFTIFMVIGFMPDHSLDWPKPETKITQNANSGTSAVTVNRHHSEAPPQWIFRIVAGVIGIIILIGWTIGGLTIYAGCCIRKRKCRTFVQVMAGFNCIWIPYGTALGVATFLLFGLPEVKEEFLIPPSTSN